MLSLSDKRILVTGGAGFLGSRVVTKLKLKGCRYISIPRSKDCDLTNLENVIRLYQDFRPDIVIHMAAKVGGINANIAAPGEYFYQNIIMGIYLIEQARIFGVQKFVAIGSACSYPKIPPAIPFREEDLWNGYPEETNAPYAFAKKMLIIQSQAYGSQFGLRSVNLILNNLYGPRDKFDPGVSHVVAALIKKFVDAIEKGENEVSVWGTGAPLREFLYVDDAASAVILATEKCEISEPINIGTGKEISIRDLAELIANLTGFKGKIIWDLSKPDGQPRRCLDTSKAEKAFSFKARTSIKDGLKETIKWYRTTYLGTK